MHRIHFIKQMSSLCAINPQSLLGQYSSCLHIYTWSYCAFFKQRAHCASISFRAPDTQKGGKKNPVLCEQFPSKSEGKELKMVVQPETQHRARYLTEGSRGSVKDRTQQGFPTVKVRGQRILEHGFIFQGCKALCKWARGSMDDRIPKRLVWENNTSKGIYQNLEQLISFSLSSLNWAN